MSVDDSSVELRAQGWRTLAALYALIEDALERALQRELDLSVSEYGVLDVLSRQSERLMRMNELSRAVVLSQSATTRLVGRLEQRGLLSRSICVEDRRGIYTEVTIAGRALLDQARPVHDGSLADALRQAEELPELAPLVGALATLRPVGAPRPELGATAARS
ncbi:MarR family winged helix-turn-helix transcriptional regulator [Streptomyces sp. NPDC057702]|uniref:MarR family winged helix-turn-helix transcriptional regulator n=1 Tax=unclassified Streptomyces TaxID=2593676 RepID=UPI0036A4AE8F